MAGPARTPTGALLALVAGGAVALQLVLSLQLSIDNGHGLLHGLVVFTGYFTVLTNAFVAAVAAAPWLAGSSRLARWFARDSVLGCATSSILLVGLAYHLLLREIWDPQGAQWLADVLLHYAVPALALLHWLGTRGSRRLSWSAPLAWCAWPAVFLAYALLRGAWLGTYPYPFIDVGALGYLQVLRNALGMLVVFIVIALLVRMRGGSSAGGRAGQGDHA